MVNKEPHSNRNVSIKAGRKAKMGDHNFPEAVPGTSCVPQTESQSRAQIETLKTQIQDVEYETDILRRELRLEKEKLEMKIQLTKKLEEIESLKAETQDLEYEKVVLRRELHLEKEKLEMMVRELNQLKKDLEEWTLRAKEQELEKEEMKRYADVIEFALEFVGHFGKADAAMQADRKK